MSLNTNLEDVDLIILQADGLIDDSHGYGHPIHQRLNELGISSAVVDIAEKTDRLDSLPRKPLIISGGMTEVTADIDWIRDLKSFVHDIIQNKKETQKRPILGICFGAQIIAESFSKGSVQYLEDPEIGISRITLKHSNHPLFSGFNIQFPAYSFHYNQIWSDDVIVLSDHYHKGHHFIQAFEIPESLVFGVQFHPEFKQNEMLRLLETHKSLIREFGFDLSPVMKSLAVVSGNHKILENYHNYVKVYSM